MGENVMVRPAVGPEFPATVLNARSTTFGREVEIEYQSVIGLNRAWIPEARVRPRFVAIDVGNARSE